MREFVELKSMKKLIELFVDRVTVYEDHVELMIKVKPDLSLPSKDEDKSGSDEHNKSCPLDGAEGGTRTHTWSPIQDFESSASANSTTSAQ